MSEENVLPDPDFFPPVVCEKSQKLADAHVSRQASRGPAAGYIALPVRLTWPQSMGTPVPSHDTVASSRQSWSILALVVPVSPDTDRRVRLAAFAYLDAQRCHFADAVFPRDLLLHGFELDGRQVGLMSPAAGIWKPAILDIPLSLTTAPIVEGQARPYEDETDASGFIRYKYRGTDPQHADNRGVRRAMLERVPLIYFAGVTPGRYLAAWPAYVAGDDPGSLTFTVAIDDRVMFGTRSGRVAEDAEDNIRRYTTAAVQRRLHQQTFRERVLQAYRDHCAICRLRHKELLDAAHIISDNEPHGVPTVANGIALCKLHHAAFDSHIIGVTPDCVIEVREDILREIDGPMLLHGLQGFHGSHLRTPREERWKPGRDFLAERYERFRRAG